jgi:hypothetical protein
MKAPIGRVYILSNRAMPGLLKIGYTMNTVEGRVKELSSATGVPSEFFIEYQVECRDAASVEALVHESLTNARFDNKREFFSISLLDAVEMIRTHAKEIIEEEFYGSATEISKSNNILRQSDLLSIEKNRVATFYLIRINNDKSIYRIGVIRELGVFLEGDEFKSMIMELYSHFNSNYFYDLEVIRLKEFEHVDDEALDSMRKSIDYYIKKLKILNKSMFELGQSMEKYDDRTFALKVAKDSFPVQIYNVCLSLLEPFAKASLNRVRSQLEYIKEGEKESESRRLLEEKLIRVDVIRKMGI